MLKCPGGDLTGTFTGCALINTADIQTQRLSKTTHWLVNGNEFKSVYTNTLKICRAIPKTVLGSTCMHLTTKSFFNITVYGVEGKAEFIDILDLSNLFRHLH